MFERTRLLEKELQGWSASDDEYELYEVWKTHKVLPYGGGWAEQPERIHELFRKCGLADELEIHNSKRPAPAKAQGTFED